MKIIDGSGKYLDHAIYQATFVWETPSSTAVWTIPHRLGRYPSVTCIESTGEVIYGKVKYLDVDTVEITFLVAITGKAFLN